MAETISERTEAGEVREIANVYEAGNEADFEHLYQTSYGKILGTLTAMLGDRAAAEDCVQDAFERAYKKWPTWQPIAPAEAWVHRIAINAAPAGPGARPAGSYRAPRPGDRARAAAAEAGGRDRAPALSRLHQPGDRAGAWHPRAHGCLSPGRRQGAAARDVEALLRPRRPIRQARTATR